MLRFNLFCSVHGDPDAAPFGVKIEKDETVSDLKEYIKDKKRPEFDHFAPDRLKLWKWNKPTDEVGDLNVNDVLDPRCTIGDVFKADAPLQGRTHIIINIPASISPSSSAGSKLSAYTLKRPHPPNDPDSVKRLKTDTSGSDLISAGLTTLWNSAWGKKSETTLFETRKVDRDGTLSDVRTPRTCMVLNVPGNILNQFFISTILIRQEYVMALTFAILIARGGRPSEFRDHRKNESDTPKELVEPLPELSPDLAMQPNPFLSLNALHPNLAGAVAFLGHPGIGKTLCLVYVLVCRMLASLPSVYMEEPGIVYIIDSSGVKTIDIKDLKYFSITDEYWCLVDSNKNLEVPKAIYSLGTFIIQSASPRDKRTEWWIKYPRPLRSFFMKEWDLSELIIARTVQKGINASELDLKTFLDRFIPSAREAFAYAANQNEYETLIRRKLSYLGREMITQLMDSSRLLSFDKDVSHHLVLITPSGTSRSQHLTEIPTRFLYEQITGLARTHALDAAFLLYEAFKEVNQTTSAAVHMYEDFTRYLIPLGGQWPVISMTKVPRSQKNSQTGTAKADACLRIGRSGGPPFEFVTALLSDNATFGKLKCMGFQKDERLVLEDGFYYPFIKTQTDFDGFVYNAEMRTATVLRVTVSKKHSVSIAGFEWLKSLGVEKVYFVGITPVGMGLDLPVDLEWDDSFVAKVYHLRMEPVRPKQS